MAYHHQHHQAWKANGNAVASGIAISAVHSLLPNTELHQGDVQVLMEELRQGAEQFIWDAEAYQDHPSGVGWSLGSFVAGPFDRRKADLDQSDGEEDFYYTELDVNVDSLTDGLSSLTPVSPTSSVPPAFPILEEIPQTSPIPFKPEVSTVSHLSQLTPAVGPTGSVVDLKAPSPGMEISISWQQPTYFPPPLPPVIFKKPSGCLTPIQPADLGEKRPQVPPVPIAKGHPLVPSCMPKPTTGTRKPRGEAKKCRKVYGMENRNMWCTACRWKKACQRFVD
ncbi:hypothetical protein JD844_019200 [Phrynosoma platyrhinos]|uniref:SLC2A4 regulator n=1 Tax=Phrynosoma platyrhinos TaxID=52577 RepID=A0ABQ7SPT1_PHRPL|nr:hypothetical protein JD844_019200 [Phrynosoma platyrhinos]